MMENNNSSFVLEYIRICPLRSMATSLKFFERPHNVTLMGGVEA